MDDTSEMIASRMSGRVPGVSAAVVGGAGVRWIGGAGTADLSTGAPASAETVYLWFSMTKIVTATATMQLVDEGAIDMDEPAAKHYPEILSLRPSTDARRISVRNLLSHTSGLANPIPVGWVHAADAPFPDPKSFLAEQLRKHARLRFAPGARSSYSNLGYLVLGEVIAEASGVAYRNYVTDRILGPLGMSDTGFVYSERMSALAATGYDRRRSPMTLLMRRMVPKGIFGPPVGAFVSFNRFLLDGSSYGGLVGSVKDGARFLRAHLMHGELDGVRMISPESAKLMRDIKYRGRRFDLGLGWFRPAKDRNRSPRFIEHLGAGGGFFNCMRIYPEKGLGVLAMGNSTKYPQDDIVSALVEQWSDRR